MNAETKHNTNSDDAFFVDARSRNLDDALAGKITFDQYFNDVDRDAKARAATPHPTDGANTQHEKLKRVVSLATFAALIFLLPVVYIIIGVASFLEPHDSAIPWLSMASAIATFMGAFRLRNIFKQAD